MRRDARVGTVPDRYRWDCAGASPTFDFYYGLWSAQAVFPKTEDAPRKKRHTAFVGYRFETPEEGDNHNYYHAQPCRSMGRKDDEIEVALPISNRAPTWPLAADGGLELLLCLVTALYGMDGLVALRGTLMEDPAARRIEILRTGFDRILGLRRPRSVGTRTDADRGLGSWASSTQDAFVSPTSATRTRRVPTGR
ncbi:hypothetical protein [Methylobacterium radiodurans]|uniref:Uncharacterized protein n=1 Tax=Methylobacterium radiodurans TaxID=2202828 RepID=A0A2U8VNM9_9HYPH|nr:hypothetical protein [Methylobacterium radiodurans]AWN35215.1 hypothetical protein DK427_05255 [Methylobacterium radiodurans]